MAALSVFRHQIIPLPILLGGEMEVNGPGLRDG